MLYLPPGEEDRNHDPVQIDWTARFNTLAQQSTHPALKRYYQQGVPAADTPISQVPMVAVDFETTGMNPDQHAIVSIAVIPMKLGRIQLGSSKQWLVKPRRALTDESITIHGITHSDIERAPDFEEVIEPLLEAIAGKVWVVHYHGIERPFLQGAVEERLHQQIEFPLIDTMDIEARFHRQKRTLWDKLRSKPKASIRLADSRQRYNLPFYAPHDAMTDALASAELLQAQIAYHFRDDTPLKDIWLP